MSNSNLRLPAHRRRKRPWQFGVKWLVGLVVLSALAIRGYVYWSQREIRRVSTQIAESTCLSEVDKTLLQTLVWQKTVLSSELGLELGLFWRTKRSGDGGTVRRVESNCRVLWRDSQLCANGDSLDIFVVKSNEIPIFPGRPKFVVIVLDTKGRLCGWERSPQYNFELVSAATCRSDNALELVVVIRTLSERVDLTYSISSRGPHLQKSVAIPDRSLFQQQMDNLYLRCSEDTASPENEQQGENENVPKNRVSAGEQGGE